jgi:uncharacterized damage-inducible protein DinB
MSGDIQLPDLLESAFRGPAWHGPALLEALAGIDTELANGRRDAAHTIHELVLHVVSWKRTVVRRLAGEAFEPEDFPAPQGWTETLENLEFAHRDLMTAARQLDETKLRQLAPGRDHTVAFMLQGAAFHDIYHAGQIGLLKKLGA